MALRSLIFVLSYLTILILSKCNSRVVIHSICYCTHKRLFRNVMIIFDMLLFLLLCANATNTYRRTCTPLEYELLLRQQDVLRFLCVQWIDMCVFVCSFLIWTNPCRRAIGQSELCHRLFYDHSDIRTYIQTHHETHPGKCVNRPSCTEIDSGVPSLLSNLRIKSINLLKMCSPINYNILEWLKIGLCLAI